MICETAMGIKVSAQSDENFEYFRCISEFLRIAFTRIISALKRYNFAFYFTKDYSIQERSVKYLHEYTDGVINQNLGRENNASLAGDKEREKYRTVLLDLLVNTALTSNEGLSLNDVKYEVNAFLLAGHHTTASAANFILYCLSNNTTVQDKVYQEQQLIFGKEKNSKTTYANLQEMRYLECVIKESLRLYPPVVMFAREVTQEVTYNGIILPKGINVVSFAHGLHMNPKYYPDPKTFDPSRFENADETLYSTYMPFGVGPRICIGQRYAMLEIKCLVGKVIRNFEIMPAVPEHILHLTTELVIKSTNGIKIGLKPR